MTFHATISDQILSKRSCLTNFISLLKLDVYPGSGESQDAAFGKGDRFSQVALVTGKAGLA